MNPNHNFEPLHILKKDTIESESGDLSSLTQPPNMFSTMKKKSSDNPSTNNHTLVIFLIFYPNGRKLTVFLGWRTFENRGPTSEQ